MRKLKIFILGGALLSCGDADVMSAPEVTELNAVSALAAEVTVAKVNITPWSVSLGAGATYQFGLQMWESSGSPVTGRTATWASNRPHIATVNTEGLVNAIAEGRASITAVVDGRTAYATVNVSGTAPAPTPVASITISPESGSIGVGQTLQLGATARDANNNILTGRALAWTTSNAGIATVSGSGLVTGVAAGSVNVVVVSEGRADTAAITVNAAAPTIASISVAPATASVEQGEVVQLAATARNSNGGEVPGQTFVWTSSNGSIASVNSSGLVMAGGEGTATISASAGGVSGTANITVTVTPPPPPTVASVTITPATSNLEQGQTVQLTATARNQNGEVVAGQAFTWTSNNGGIASVNGSGLVMAVGSGTATITATTSGVSGTASVTVSVPPPTVSTVTVTPGASSVGAGQTVQLTATARSSSGTVVAGLTFSWTSTNPGVATVNANGLVTGVAAGTATIAATTIGISGNATVTVTAPEPPPPTGGALLFFSDWRTRAGNTLTALSDGGKWNSMSAQAEENGSIIDAPAGFPTHKIFRVASNGTRDGWIAPHVTTLGVIPIGSTRNYRFYHAFHEPATADNGQHPIQDGGAVSQSNWFFSTHNRGGNLLAGQWGLDYQFEGTNDGNLYRFTLGARDGQYTPLTKGVVYRHEVQVARISATQFRFHVWIYDAAGNLLYDDDDFRSALGNVSLANNPTFTFQNVANTSIFLIGLNGIGNSPQWPIHSSDQAGVAIMQGLNERQPIGPYGAVQGEIRR